MTYGIFPYPSIPQLLLKITWIQREMKTPNAQIGVGDSGPNKLFNNFKILRVCHKSQHLNQKKKKLKGIPLVLLWPNLENFQIRRLLKRGGPVMVSGPKSAGRDGWRRRTLRKRERGGGGVKRTDNRKTGINKIEMIKLR